MQFFDVSWCLPKSSQFDWYLAKSCRRALLLKNNDKNLFPKNRISSFSEYTDGRKYGGYVFQRIHGNQISYVLSVNTFYGHIIKKFLKF